jgi:hypothetical protein
MANGQYEQLNAAINAVDPQLSAVLTQAGQGGQANQQALQQLQEAAQAAGFQVAGVSQLDAGLDTLSGFEEQFLNSWILDKARAIIALILQWAQRVPHCIEGVRLATEAVNLFRAGQYLAAIAKGGAALAAFQRCVA